ncbi:MAG: hypothetical protein LBL51_05670, partial [Synergistaceae bacterium]|nr:hypothetical protein [Synergistaceae bacterium]
MKIVSRVCAFLAMLFVILALCLAYGPVGFIVEPLVRRYGESGSVPSLRVGSVEGSLYSGVTLNGIELISGDNVLLSADRVMFQPSWSLLLRGELWLSELEIAGVRADVEDLSALAARYGTTEKREGPGLTLKPVRAFLRDIELRSSLFSLSLDEALLTQDGFLFASADLDGLPLRAEGLFSFSPLEAVSFDARAGSGRLSLAGRLEAPFDVQGMLNGARLEEFPRLASLGKIDGGELDGYFYLESKSAAGVEDLSARGALRLARGRAAGVPVAGTAPWTLDDGIFSSKIQLEGLSAELTLQVSADLRPASFA